MGFIWINGYSDYERTYCTMFADKKGYRFGVAEFVKLYKFDKKVTSAQFTVFGDTKFRFWVNGELEATGPVCAGGDYGKSEPMPYVYTSKFTTTPDTDCISLFAQVQLSPAVQADTSMGRGGFFMQAEVTFEDGSIKTLETNSSWLSRLNRQYISANETDYRTNPDPWKPAEEIESVWKMLPSPIENLTEEVIYPDENFEFDRIYSGYIQLEIEALGDYKIEVNVYELKGTACGTEIIRGNTSTTHRSLKLYSVGGYEIKAIGAVVKPSVIFSHYPIKTEGTFECSDGSLNTIYEVGKHTLHICRQTYELDSPRHQENLGCTGDYFIESLIAYTAYGETKLSRLDIERTANLLRATNGKMFHTTYSLIFVQMLYDNYMFSGDKSILSETFDAIEILLDRFRAYCTDGIIENPPDYMFIDWINVDEYTMHHPPKALGQTCMNAFYYKALTTADKIADILGKQTDYAERADQLKANYNSMFFDYEKGLYFDGKNDRYTESKFLPPNSQKRYYSRHSNTLSVLYGLAEKPREIMEKVVNEEGLIDVQPYFMHFCLEALYSCDLFEKYGLSLIRKWKVMTDESIKGMHEGWIKAEGYNYDFSHAWGCSPTYHLPAKLLGLKMLRPGFEEISIRPKLYGLKSVHIKMPTPYGMIECHMNEGNIPKLTIPKEISIKFI